MALQHNININRQINEQVNKEAFKQINKQAKQYREEDLNIESNYSN